jgi:hypothetical protein
MKIIRERNNAILPFKEIEKGEVFQHGDKFYIKIEKRLYHITCCLEEILLDGNGEEQDFCNARINAIDLSNGASTCFEDDDLVLSIKGEFVIHS